MTLSIENYGTSPPLRSDVYAERGDFNSKVLHYLQTDHPEGHLQALLEKLKEFSPNFPLTLTQLNAAMISANVIMQDDPNHREYVTNTLNTHTRQLANVNMIYIDMLNEIFLSITDPDNKPDEW